MPETPRRRIHHLTASLVMTIALIAAACSSEDSGKTTAAGGETNSPATKTAGDEKKVEGTLVAFIPSTNQNYLAGWARGARKEAERRGIPIQIIENNFDQNEEDSQVRQQLGSGTKVAAYIWWPANAPAGQASLTALSATGVPVIQTNQGVVPGTEKLLAAYAGVDDAGNGIVTGQNVVAARDAMKAAGLKLHSDGGNFIIVGLATGYQAGIVRNREVIKVAEAAGMKNLGTIDAGFDSAAGYKGGSQLITKAKAQGIDVVVSLIDNLSAGVIRALEEQGFKPGKDVYVVAGTCSAGLPFIRDGREYASGIQPAEYEGALAVTTAVEAVTKGKVADFTKFMPNQSITKENIDTFKFDGKTVDELCAQ